MNILASFAVLGLLIFFHELGHFLAAILQGIRVNGFSIGFGPALIQKELRGVTYSLRLLPLGGFVAFPDDQEDNEIPKNDPNLLKNRPIKQRALVISAGVIANLLLAWLVLIGQATFIGLPNQADPGAIVLSIQEGGAADISGLRAGDQIIKINGKELGIGEDAVRVFVERIQSSPGKSIELEGLREGKNKLINITPIESSGAGRIGAQLQPNILNGFKSANGINEIISHANYQFVDFLLRTINGYKGLITNFSKTSQQLSGPVKIIQIGAQLSNEGGSGLILFAALISINLAVLNSLPFPLLDGGQMVLLLLEGIRGKPIPEKVQIVFMQSGFFLLVGLSVVLIIRDTAQLSLFQHLISN